MIDEFDIFSYDKIKEHIYYKLMKRSWNVNYLNDKYYIPYLDLVIIFYVVISETCIVPVTKKLLKIWNFPKDIYSISRTKAMKKQKIQLISLKIILMDILNGKDLENINECIYMASDISIWGNSTSLLIDPPILEQFSAKWDSNTVIYPFWDDLILAPENKLNPNGTLEQILGKEGPFFDKRLSDQTYFFNRENKRVTIV